MASFSMYFGMFGSIFFFAQYAHNVLHSMPLQGALVVLALPFRTRAAARAPWADVAYPMTLAVAGGQA